MACSGRCNHGRNTYPHSLETGLAPFIRHLGLPDVLCRVLHRSYLLGNRSHCSRITAVSICGRYKRSGGEARYGSVLFCKRKFRK